MMTPEGRAIKEGSNWRFEYFHKDHLGNTRVVYGNQKQVDEYLATMETQKATKEQAQFYNITTTRVSANNHTPISIDLTAAVSSAETNGYKTGKAIGPAKMLQVSAGDRVQLEVFARYTTGTGSNNTLITNLASAVTTTFQVVSGEAAFTALTNNVPVQAATITKLSTVPKAYLFYILFNSSYVYQQFGYAQISSTASTAHQQLYLDITIPTGGFLYTYVADESKVNNASSVYFDDFNIIHTRNNNTLQVMQTTDYYPFGLAMAAQSYQKQSTLDNDYLYNGKELQDEHNLGWMDYGARMYMSDIGRWNKIDRLSGRYWTLSPYHYAGNNPINFYDINGDYFSGQIGYVERMRKEAREGKQNAIYSIERNIQKVGDALTKGDITSAEMIAGNVKKSLEDRDEYQNTLNEIDALDNSSQEYHIADGLTGSSAKTSWDNQSKAVRIDISASADVSLIAHEFKHAYQFESGTASFGTGPSGKARGNLLFDLTDEFEGYKRQALFNRSLLPSPLDKGVTIDNIRQIETSDGVRPYKDFPTTQQVYLPAINNANIRDGAYKKISNTFQQAFRANGKTYYPGVQ